MRRHLVVTVDQEMGRSEHFLYFSDYCHTFSLCLLFCGIFSMEVSTFFVYDGRMIPEYMKGVSYRRAGLVCDCLT
jgi:hypothetical protein